MSSVALLLASTTPCFLACTPVGPDEPFGSPLLVVVDTLRILSLLGGVFVVIVTPSIILRVAHWGQAVRFGALFGFCLVSIDSRLEHLGDYPSLRMLFDVAAIVAAVVGVWSYLRCGDDRRRDRPRRRGR